MSTATDMRDAYLAAEMALLRGQSYRMGDRVLTLANLPEIQKGRQEWERRADGEARQAAGIGGPLSVYGASFTGNCSPEGSDGWSPLG